MTSTSWRTDDDTQGQAFGASDDGSEVLVATRPSGSQDASCIAAGSPWNIHLSAHTDMAAINRRLVEATGDGV